MPGIRSIIEFFVRQVKLRISFKANRTQRSRVESYYFYIQCLGSQKSIEAGRQGDTLEEFAIEEQTANITGKQEEQKWETTSKYIVAWTGW
jgi:hypothetical protein